MEEPTKTVGVRFSTAMLDRLDAHVDRMRREHPGARFTRADAIRMLLTHALDEVEEKEKSSES